MHQANTKPHLQIENNEILAAGLSCIQLGWPVIPVHRTDLSGRCSCGWGGCNSQGKHPKGMGWQKRATTDQNQVEKWFAAGLQNIGIVCGKEAGLWVLDVDGDEFKPTLAKSLASKPETAICLIRQLFKRPLCQRPDGRRKEATMQSSTPRNLTLLLTPQQAAEALAISPQKLWSMTTCGEIPHIRLGRSLRYPAADLQRWIEQHKQEANHDPSSS